MAAMALTSLKTNAAVHYVNVGNLTPQAPYSSWATAASQIQDAVDVAGAGDEIIVTNGVYQVGGRVTPPHTTYTNRVMVPLPMIIRSVNGPDHTVIRGYQVPETVYGWEAVRGVYLTSGATLDALRDGRSNGRIW
jgi:hypothetical protein